MALNLKGMAPLLQVFDMPTSLRFYREILGFMIVQSSGEGDNVNWVLLSLNDIEIMLNTAYEKDTRPDSPNLERISIHSDTILYFGCPDIEGTYSILVKKGIDIRKPATTGYGWKALDLFDPDGYHLCFHWPLEKTADSNIKG